MDDRAERPETESLREIEAELNSLTEVMDSGYSPVFSDFLVNHTADQRAVVHVIGAEMQRMLDQEKKLRRALDELYAALTADTNDDDEYMKLQARLADAENGSSELEQMLDDLKQAEQAGTGKLR